MPNVEPLVEVRFEVGAVLEPEIDQVGRLPLPTLPLLPGLADLRSGRIIPLNSTDVSGFEPERKNADTVSRQKTDLLFHVQRERSLAW